MEKQYLCLLKKVLEKGEIRDTRNAVCLTLFGETIRFSAEKVPLISTKKLFIRGIVEELLFFLRGDTNTKILEEKGVNFWKKNTENRDGEMGPMYGYQWRNFNGEIPNSKAGISDQLEYVIKEIKNNPTSRRIVMTDYNPLQALDGVLFPCHSLMIQFFVRKTGQLDMTCYNRSSDLFLGLPFNLVSTALLLTVVAKICLLTPGEVILNLGDVHIYETHIPAVKKQLSRNIIENCGFVKLVKNISCLKDLEELKFEDFEIVGYKHHEVIKAEMIA